MGGGALGGFVEEVVITCNLYRRPFLLAQKATSVERGKHSCFIISSLRTFSREMESDNNHPHPLLPQGQA